VTYAKPVLVRLRVAHADARAAASRQGCAPLRERLAGCGGAQRAGEAEGLHDWQVRLQEYIGCKEGEANTCLVWGRAHMHRWDKGMGSSVAQDPPGIQKVSVGIHSAPTGGHQEARAAAGGTFRLKMGVPGRCASSNTRPRFWLSTEYTPPSACSGHCTKHKTR
jgi:hypothetical protein